MHTHRQLASASALAIFVLLAFGSESTEEGSSSTWDEPMGATELDEPSEDLATTTAPSAGASGDCAPWTGTGTPVASIEELFDTDKLQSMGRKLDMNVECYDIDTYDGDEELDCNFWNDKWAFDIEVSKFRSSQDAKWEIEDPWAGEAYRRQGNWVLNVDAQNGTCAKLLMDTVVPKNEPLKSFNEDRIVSAIKAAGWTIGDGGCSMEKYDGDMSFDCPMENGSKLEGSFSLNYEIDGGSRVEEEREIDSGYYYLRQAYGYASCSIDDTASAEALLKALIK